MNKLEFISSQTIEDFKATVGVSKIDVVKNPKTNKLFFTDGVKVLGACSNNFAENPRISLVKLGETKFYLMHKGAANNVIATY